MEVPYKRWTVHSPIGLRKLSPNTVPDSTLPVHLKALKTSVIPIDRDRKKVPTFPEEDRSFRLSARASFSVMARSPQLISLNPKKVTSKFTHSICALILINVCVSHPTVN